MPVNFEVGENGRLCTLTVTHPWTIVEFTACYPLIQRQLDTASEKVQMLFDFTEAGRWSGNAFSARNAPFTKHPRMGDLAVINTSSLVEAVADVMIRLAGTHYTHFFKTKAEGLAFLQEQINARTDG